MCELGTEVFGLMAYDEFICWAIVINGWNCCLRFFLMELSVLRLGCLLPWLSASTSGRTSCDTLLAWEPPILLELDVPWF
jgi:hypothetical protein